MALAIAYLLYDKFTGESSPVTSTAIEQTAPVLQNISLEAEDSSRNKDRAKSIAVLPFTNRSPDANDAYFTDGVHDDLLTQLAKEPEADWRGTWCRQHHGGRSAALRQPGQDKRAVD